MNESPVRIEQQDADELRAHYTWKKKALEGGSVVVFTGLVAAMVVRLMQATDLWAHGWLLLVAFLVGMIAADFVSGFVHWLADTWGTVELPILGPTLVKNFREHHAAPRDLAKKGLIETNGDNCMVLIPVQVGVLLMPIDGSAFWVLFHAFALSFAFWIMLTNQIHKWAHMRRKDLWLPVRALQRAGVFLTVSEHAKHHTVPFESHYCITNGWMNGPLQRVRFFRTLERIIWRVSGMIPRENDIGTHAAVAVAVKQGILPEGFQPTRHIVGTQSTPTRSLS